MIAPGQDDLAAAGVMRNGITIVENLIAFFHQQQVALRTRRRHCLGRQLGSVGRREGKAFATVEIGVLTDEAIRRKAPDDSRIDQGRAQIVFLGQTVNSWKHESHDVADLLRAANDVPGVKRIRGQRPSR